MDNLWDLVKGLEPSDTFSKVKTLDRITRKAALNGLHWVNEGSYSSVYMSPKDNKRVVKVTGSAVDAYHKYAEWVVNYGSKLPPKLRKHLPKIHQTESRNGFRITVMEKLTRSYNKNAENHPTFEEALDIVVQYAYRHSIKLDIADRNILWRNNKTPVIVDPWMHGRPS